MNIPKSPSLALLTLALAAFALPQVTLAAQSATDLMTRLLTPIPRAALPAAAGARSAVALGLAKTRIYRFAVVDYPGAAGTIAYDANTEGTAVGQFTFGTATSIQTGFVQLSGLAQALALPGSGPGSSLVAGVNTSGATVGGYTDNGAVEHGFVDIGGVVTNIDYVPGNTVAFDINDAGVIVGGGGTAGFSTADNGASFTAISYPGSNSTIAAGIDSAGDIVGVWTDASSNRHGFLLSGGVYTSLDFPLATDTVAIGINDFGEIAGYYSDASNVLHGFIYSAGSYASVDVPGASGTELTRIKNNHHIVGVFLDQSTTTETHGFIGR